MDFGLAGSSALVTGGSTGIGRATVLKFAEEGARVVVADVNEADGRSVVDEIRGRGGEGVFVRTDVADAAQVEAAVACAVDNFGRLDSAVNCAAITLKGPRFPIADTDIEVFDRLISVNLRGVFVSMKYELRQMERQGSGSIVNISSGAGLRAGPGNPSYIAAKHGLIGLSKSGSVEYADKGIRVNTLAPGLTRTPILEGTSVDNAQMARNIPLGRMAEPPEIANGIVWLCSPVLASFVTGITLIVDGGALQGG